MFYHLLEMATVNGYAICKHKWPGKFRSNTSLHCELAHALCCPLQAIHSVIFVVVDKHWNCGYSSKSRSSYVWLLQRSICTQNTKVSSQNTSGLNFCGFCDSSSHPQIFSSMNIWAKVLHNCCKNGRRIRCTLTCSTVVFLVCLGTNMHQFSIRLPNTLNAITISCHLEQYLVLMLPLCRILVHI